MKHPAKPIRSFLGVLCVFLTGCTSIDIAKAPVAPSDANRSNFGSIFGDSAILLKGKKEQKRSLSRGKVAVNKFLWEGAIETIAFMPILMADPTRGRIATDWYSAEERPDIRVRVLVTIAGQELRADAIHVFVERQKKSRKKGWQNSRLAQSDCTKLEILMVDRARKIRKNMGLNRHSCHTITAGKQTEH
ncbi:MAG: DUF3576 domain-containing protein [Holosporales bacterium]|jgi:hypothetical protein|nr:DUF3576 domain-containing protein [Holosporales bacterium]